MKTIIALAATLALTAPAFASDNTAPGMGQFEGGSSDGGSSYSLGEWHFGSTDPKKQAAIDKAKREQNARTIANMLARYGSDQNGNARNGASPTSTDSRGVFW